MADLLPDIPSDVYNTWAGEQFAQAAQEKIASLHSDISSSVQSALAPPAPAPLPPEPEPEPAPPPPEPVPAPTPAPPQPAPVPPPTPEPAPAPDLSTPLPDVPAPPDMSAPPPAPPPPTPPPTPTPAPPSPTASSGWDIGKLLGAADSAGADMGQFSSALNQHLQSAGSNVVGAALGAADTAGADMGQFSSALGSLVPQAPQSLGIQGPTSSTPGDMIDQARQAAQAAGIDPDIFTRQIQQESGFNPNARSGAGALGIAQFMPGTAQGLGLDPTDPIASLQAAARMDAQNLQQYGGDWGKTLAAYNAGPGNVAKYGGIPPFEETQTYVSNILGGAKNIVQQAADSGVQAVNSIGEAAQSAAARTSQFAMGLSPGDAMAFCGPAAAMAFAQTFGRNPTVDEAKQLAQQVGWNPSQGMAGPGSEVALLNQMGIDTHMTQGVDWAQVAKDASSGNPVIIDTPGHYFYVQGYNPDTGQFNLGKSATDLKAAQGQQWFTPDQIPSLGMGDPRAAIFADHPLSGAGVASAAPQTFMGGLQDAGGNLVSQAQDTLSAVLSTGLQTAQDVGSKLQSALPTGEGLRSALDTLGGGLPDITGSLQAPPTSTPLGQVVAGAPIGSLSPTDQLQALQQLNQGYESSRALATEALTGNTPLLSGAASMATDPETILALMGLGGPNAALADMVGGGTIGRLAAGALTGTALGGLQGAQQPGATAQDVLVQALLGGPLGVAGAGAGEALGALSPAVRDLLADPTLQAALRSRQPAQADVNAALGGLPGLLENAGRTAYNAAVQSNLTPATGAGQLARALDALSAYPEDVANPIRDFASSIEAPPSQVASTLLRWIQDNPLHQMPDVTQPAAVARDVGQQAVADIADMVRNGGVGRGPYLPGGVMPGQIGLLSGFDTGLLPEAGAERLGTVNAQGMLPEGTGGAGLPSAGLTADQQSWLLRMQQAAAQRDFGGMQDLLQQANLIGDYAGPKAGPLTAEESWAQRMQDQQGALPISQGSGELAGMTPEQQAWLQRQVATQPAIPAGHGGMQDLIDALTTPAPPAAAQPGALSQVAGAPGAAASGLGTRVASALNPTENLPPAIRNVIEDFAAVVGRNSRFADVAANLQAVMGGLPADVEERMAQGIRNQSTTDMLEQLRDLKMAAPAGQDPAKPGFRAPKGQGWKIGSQDPGSELSRWLLHPDVQGPINAVVGHSWIADNPLFGSVLRAGNVGKGTIFSLSNFHTYTEMLNTALSSPSTAVNMARAFASDNFAQGLRGKMATSIGNAARAGVTNMLEHTAPDAGDLAQAGLRRAIGGATGGLGGGAAGYYEAKLAGKSDDEAWAQAKAFGAAGAALGGFPMVAGGRGTVAEELSKALWQRAVPVAKASVWQGLVDGGMDAKLAAKVVNERFGGLNYAMMGRNPTLQDAMRLGVMAPDWGESTVRQMGRLLGGPGTGEARAFVGKAVGGMFLVTQLINHALSGHWTNENQPGHEFEVEVKDPAGGYSHTGLIPGNFLSYLNLADKLKSDPSAKKVSDLQNFAVGRMAALPATAADLVRSGSSNTLTQPYGYSKAGLSAVLQNLAPIGVSQVAQGINSGGEDPATTILKALIGLNPRYTNPTTTTGTTGGGTMRAPNAIPAPSSAPGAAPIRAPAPIPAPGR